MVYGSNRDFDRSESSNLRAAVSGGLNTASSDLMTPLEESPEMNNIQVDFDGMVRKRKGYKTLLHRNVTASGQHSYIRGAFYIPFQMSSGRPVIIGREEERLILHVRQDDGTWYTFGGFSDVFGSKGVNNQFDYIIQNDGLYSRIILVSGSTVPIQVSTVSSSTTYVKGGSGTAWTFPDESVSWGHVTGFPSLCLMVVDGVVETVSAITATTSGLATSLAITSTNSYPADTYEVELLYITWQWWAEALQLRGAQFVQTVVQGTSTKTIAVPSILLQGIEPYSGGLPPLRAQSSSNYDAVFTRTNPPTTSSQYTYSNGSDSDGTTPVSPAPYYLAFGAAPTSVRNVTIIRGYFLPFYAGSVQQDAGAVQVVPYYNANLGVRYSTAPPSEGGAGVGAANFGFHLRIRSGYQVSTGTTSTRVPRYVTLDATNTASGGLAQVSSEEIYHIIDVTTSELETNGYLGTNATEGSIPTEAKSFTPEFPPIPKHTYGFPAAGISWFADYRRGSFPRTIGTMQGRIVLAGFRDKPMTIAFSNPYDSDAPGYYANNFDVVYTIPSAVSPFDITLPGAANDIITNLIEFNDSLFVFTRHRVFRVHADNNGIITFANARYSLIAEIGSNNPRSAVVTDNYPVFLSPSGVYAIVPDDSSAGYGIQELSSKIRNLVQAQNKTMPYTGFVTYDAGRNELYVGLSDNTSLDRCGQLLVYNTRLESWYVFTSRGGSTFQAYWAAILWDNSVSNPTSLPSVIFTTPYKYNDDDWVAVIELNQDNTPMDLHERWVYASLPYTSALPALQATFTTVNTVKEYDPNDTTFKEKAFRLSPVRDLEDCRVTLGGSLMTFGTDYVKTERGTIILTANPGAGLSLVVEARMNYEGSLYHPVGLMSSGGKIWTPGNYTVDISGDYYRITGVTPTPSVNDVLYIGYCFPAWYTTPTFNRGTLNVKRLKQYIGYYHNEVSDLWDINESYPAASNVGQRKVPIDVNIAVVFSNEYEGLLQTELYNEKAPTGYPNQQTKDYSRCIVPIVGQGYNIQVIHHNNSPTTFKLAGYELVATPKPGKGYAKSEEKLN